MRFSDFDRAIHDIEVEDGRGMVLRGPAPPAEGLLTGMPRLILPPRPDAGQTVAPSDEG